MKIVIDPGHGGSDPGAVANGLKEKDITLDISLKLYNLLKKYDVQTILTRTDDRDVTLTQRANIANTENADFFISIHINAGGGTGFESFRHPNASDRTTSIQTIIHREVANFFKSKGFADRGIKTANYAVLRETKMPAVLLENLFIDNTRDAAFLREETNRQDIAQAICNGIVQAFALKPVQQQVVQPVQTQTIYRVQVGTFTVKANAEKLANELRAKGYEAIVVEGGK